MIFSLPIKLLLAVVFGGLIGLERESSQSKDNIKHVGSVGGIRTYSLIALLGALSGLILDQNLPNIFLLIAGTMCALVVVYYFVGTSITGRTGLTTEISAVFTFLIGFFLVTNILSTQLTIAIFVMILLILSIKIKTQKFALGISHKEVESFISYAIIALVILPFLPNKAFFITDIPGINALLDSANLSLGIFAKMEILNPYRLWFIVALITGIDVIGYILGRLMSKKQSLVIASTAAGVVSSTSAIQSLAVKSHANSKLDRLVGAALFANAASMTQVFLLVTPLNAKLTFYLFPTIIIIGLASLLTGVYFLTRKSTNKGDSKHEAKKEEKIFSLMPALKFAVLLIVVRVVTKTALAFFGQSGFLISSMIGAFAGLDAILINLAELAGKAITFKSALLTFAAVNATNMLAKTIYSFMQGKKEFGYKILMGLGVVAISGFIGYFLK
ncbi:MAG TPA: DUF4010 domain-containing protein [Patescibacteria group bacterium]|nr:DUF4010 domain-containing protein [Patescibacteria group bacterium]